MDGTKIQELIQQQKNEALQSAISENPDLAYTKTSHGISMLVFAAYCRNQEALEILKALKAGQLDFYEALVCGEKATVEACLSEQANLANAYYLDGFTPLGLASFFAQEAIVEVLLKNGSDPNLIAKHPMQLAPIHSACAIAHLGIAKLLVAAGADVNVAQSSGVTPLHSAAHMGHLGLVEFLLAKGAKLLAKMEDGRTPLDFAIADGHESVAKFLRKMLEKEDR